ncbi:hypothetical protein E2C01_098801 [Portunus trituberculatus]|uniref:Uncharacterized protein n=1 Tax=Portunus trituberculatus TaxID=210409 RepID=A0A5B7K8M5_PORTR|nr:hypothetical protein [Portunus trituberculatus]
MGGLAGGTRTRTRRKPVDGLFPTATAKSSQVQAAPHRYPCPDAAETSPAVYFSHYKLRPTRKMGVDDVFGSTFPAARKTERPGLFSCTFRQIT